LEKVTAIIPPTFRPIINSFLPKSFNLYEFDDEKILLIMEELQNILHYIKTGEAIGEGTSKTD